MRLIVIWDLIILIIVPAGRCTHLTACKSVAHGSRITSIAKIPAITSQRAYQTRPLARFAPGLTDAMSTIAQMDTIHTITDERLITFN